MTRKNSRALTWTLAAFSLAAYGLAFQLIMVSPNDETGHAIGIWIFTTVWAAVHLFVATASLVINRKSKVAICKFAGLILMIPALWSFTPLLFFQVFHERIERIHSGWAREIAGLSDAAIWLLLSVSIVFAAGLGLALVSRHQEKNA